MAAFNKNCGWSHQMKPNCTVFNVQILEKKTNLQLHIKHSNTLSKCVVIPWDASVMCIYGGIKKGQCV